MFDKHFFNNSRGFTLAELMIALGIMSLVLAAIYGVSISVNRSTTRNEVKAEVLQNLRTSMDFMEQDIRMAGLDRFGLAGTGIVRLAAPISMPSASHLYFTADRNMNDAIDIYDDSDGITEAAGDLDRITYYYDAANKLLRQCLSDDTTDPSCETVAENVEAFQFSYLDSNNAQIPFPIDNDVKLSNIRAVQVEMAIRKQAGGFGPVERTLTKQIICRNLEF
jgi:prepilin-type N-terminal cleavage/methylation domain-containing protein